MPQTSAMLKEDQSPMFKDDNYSQDSFENDNHRSHPTPSRDEVRS